MVGKRIPRVYIENKEVIKKIKYVNESEEKDI